MMLPGGRNLRKCKKHRSNLVPHPLGCRSQPPRFSFIHPLITATGSSRATRRPIPARSTTPTTRETSL
jgi:hypothetical protein